MEAVSVQRFTAHPFWTDVLAIPQTGVNAYIRSAVGSAPEVRLEFLRLVVEGFYPLSYSSAQAFGRLAMLADDPMTAQTARYIHEVELGKHPFIKNSRYQDVLHCIQLKATLESLIDDGAIRLPAPEAYPVLHEMALPQADLLTALAVCDEIEHQAPLVIAAYQDFVAQWQVLTNRGSVRIDRVYLDEHSLSEGSEDEEQHIEMVERMKGPYRELTGSDAYQDRRDWYNARCTAHLDSCFRSIRALLQAAN